MKWVFDFYARVGRKKTKFMLKAKFLANTACGRLFYCGGNFETGLRLFMKKRQYKAKRLFSLCIGAKLDVLKKSDAWQKRLITTGAFGIIKIAAPFDNFF